MKKCQIEIIEGYSFLDRSWSTVHLMNDHSQKMASQDTSVDDLTMYFSAIRDLPLSGLLSYVRFVETLLETRIVCVYTAPSGSEVTQNLI
jgi:hypothetical protein